MTEVLSPSSNVLSRKRRDASNDDNDDGVSQLTKRFRVCEESIKTMIPTPLLSSSLKLTPTSLTELHLNALNIEFRSKILEKRGILEAQSKAHTKMISCITNIQQENKVLKKGIQIQDQKYKDATTHCSQLEIVMNQLVQRIHALEGNYRGLQYELGRLQNQMLVSNAYQNFPPHPPPDVY